MSIDVPLNLNTRKQKLCYNSYLLCTSHLISLYSRRFRVHLEAVIYHHATPVHRFLQCWRYHRVTKWMCISTQMVLLPTPASTLRTISLQVNYNLLQRMISESKKRRYGWQVKYSVKWYLLRWTRCRRYKLKTYHRKPTVKGTQRKSCSAEWIVR